MTRRNSNREMREAGYFPRGSCYCCGETRGKNGTQIGKNSFFLPGHNAKFNATLPVARVRR